MFFFSFHFNVLDMMISGERLIPGKAVEAREKDESLEGSENVRDSQKTVAEAA